MTAGKPYRRMLMNVQAPAIVSLKALIQTQGKQTLANWCLDEAQEHLLPLWQQAFPKDGRPLEAICSARAWLRGEAKLPQVKPVILQAHAAAREAEGQPAAQAAARAIGQCASTIHSARHCLGLALYGALALAYARLGQDTPWEQLEQRALQECARMEMTLRYRSAVDETVRLRIARRG